MTSDGTTNDPLTSVSAGPETADDREPLRIDSPDGLLAVVPHLLGFHPSRSLVVLGIGPHQRVALAFRYDLPDPADAGRAEEIGEHACFVLERERVSIAILVGYGPAALVAGVAVAAAAALGQAGVEIREVLRAEGGRYWSALCRDPDCCPDGGVSFDPCSHPASTSLTSAGTDPYPDREALARTLQPEPGTSRAIRLAASRAQRRIGRLITRAAQAGRDPSAALAEAGRAAVRAAIEWYRSGSAITDRGRLAFLGAVLAELSVRDDAWARMDPEHRSAHLRLWTDVVTGVPAELLPAPASLLAFTAWQCGNGALANVALERALTADPGYSMAILLGQAIQAGLPPSAARLPMTPEEVEEGYAAPA